MEWRWWIEWLEEQMQAMKDNLCGPELAFSLKEKGNEPKKTLAAHLDGDRETLM